MHIFRFRPFGPWLVVLLLLVFVGLVPVYADEITIGCSATELFNAVAGTTSASPRTINLAASPCTYNFTAGDPSSIDSAMLIDGVTVTINGNNDIIQRDPSALTHFRLFSVVNGGGLTLNDVTLQHGYSDSGGGAVANEYQQGVIHVSNSTFSDNTAASAGGAISNSSSGVLTVDGSTFTNNSVVGDSVFGGAIASSGTSVSVSNSTFTGNFVSSSGGAGYGGAIANSGTGSTLDVIGSTFVGRSPDVSADYGGAIWNYAGSTLTVSSSTFSGNQAVQLGGAIQNDGEGGLPTYTSITSSSFSDNAAQHGGAITNYNQATVDVTRSTFSANAAIGDGGAILNLGTLTVTDSTFTGTTRPAITNAFTLTVTNSTFSGNHNFGIANGNGAGDGGPTTVTNSTIANNGDSGIYSQNAPLTVSSSTISGNGSSFGAGGIWLNFGGTLTLTNSVVTDNANGDCSNSDGTSVINYSLVTDGTCGVVAGSSGNLTGDPALGPLADNGGPTQTMALLPGSIAINAGDPALTPPPDFDQRGAGFPRVSGGRIDMGAFEVQPGAPSRSTSGGSSSGPSTGGAETTQCAGGGSSSIPGGTIYCRVIARNGQFLASPAEIGIQSIIDMGVIQAINLVGMLPSGVAVTQFSAPVGLCLGGTGDVLFVSASDPARTIQRLPASALGSLHCVSVPGPGLVVMVGARSGIAAPPPAPASGTALTDCRVTTINAPINLRAEPDTSATILAKLPFNLTLTATALVPGWHRVIYLDGQGWVSDRFLTTLGACGG